MPRLPDPLAQQRPTPRSVRLPSVAGIGAGFARAANINAQTAGQGSGLDILAKSVRDVEAAQQKRRLAEDRLALARARSLRDSLLIETQNSFVDNPDFNSYVPSFDKSVTKGLGKIAEGLSPAMQAQFEAESHNEITSARVGVQKLARKRWADNEVALLDELETGAYGSRQKTAEYRDAVAAAVDAGALSRVNGGKRLADFAIESVRTDISAWYKAQPSPTVAAEQMDEGKMPDDIQAAYDALPESERNIIFDGNIDHYTKLLHLQDSERAAIERADKVETQAMVQDFFFDDGLSSDQLTDMWNRARRDPNVTVATLNAMDARIRGDLAIMEDYEHDLTLATSAINRGDIRSGPQLMEWMAQNIAEGEAGWRVSLKTIRTKFLPMIEQEQDERFGDYLNVARAHFGIPTGNTLLGSAFGEKIDKLATFTERFRMWRIENPEGNVGAAYNSIMADVDEMATGGSDIALPMLADAYRAALASGDPDDIAKARTVLIAIQIDAGQVTGAEASKADYDPLATIEGVE